MNANTHSMSTRSRSASQKDQKGDKGNAEDTLENTQDKKMQYNPLSTKTWSINGNTIDIPFSKTCKSESEAILLETGFG
jgi:hypothetical protein